MIRVTIIIIVVIIIMLMIRASQGMKVVSDNWLDCVFTLNSLHVQTLASTDVQTPFLGTP